MLPSPRQLACVLWLLPVLLLASGTPESGTVVSWGSSYIPKFNQGDVYSAISAGHSHSLALKSDGTVVGWGGNHYGQAAVPKNLRNVTAISAGNGYSLALKNDGIVVAWGNNNSGGGSVPENLHNVIAISAGGSHALALKNDGTVVAWGDNYSGQASVPENLRNVIAISAGDSHSLAHKIDGTVVAWGANDYGQCSVPVNLSDIVAISAGSYYSLAIKNDGDVVAWGRNASSQSSVPDNLINAISISGGGDHSLLLKGDGTVLAWGRNDFEQSMVPNDLRNVIAISAGTFHNLALKRDGTIASWGRNSFGESCIPEYLFNVIGIAAGFNHSLILKSNGTVIAWGDNYYGKATVPQNLRNVIAVSAGGQSSLALTSDGSVVAWGSQTVPEHLRNVRAIAAGGDHRLALKSDGTVVSWGRNDFGQTTVPENLRSVSAIAAGLLHSLALQIDGRVIAWGRNNAGQASVPENLSNVIAISAGASHSLALTDTGTVVAWGQSFYDQTSVLANLRDVIAISAGRTHNLALKSNGQVITWSNSSVPESLPSAIAISAGSAYSLAIVRDSPNYLHPRILANPQPRQILENQPVVFSVQVQSASAVIYQWFRNGVPVSGPASSELRIPNVSLQQSGTYHVRVSSEQGYTDSLPATLTVHPNLGALIKQNPFYPVKFTATTSADNLIVVTHGLTSEGAHQHNWIEDAAETITKLVDSTWYVAAYRWHSNVSPARGKKLAEEIGNKLGLEILESGKEKPGGKWNHIHFIGHSAGGPLIDTATKLIKDPSAAPRTIIHTTFLDPFEGVWSIEEYGLKSDWSDNYFSKDAQTLHWTAGALNHAFNVDVTGLDPMEASVNVFSSGIAGTTPTVYRSSSHSWPWQFYTNTIPPAPGFPGFTQYGFSRSKEGGGWEDRHSYPIYNEDTLPRSQRIRTPGETVVFSSQRSVQNSSLLSLNEEQTIFNPGSTINFQTHSFLLGTQLGLEPKTSAKSLEPIDNAWLSIGLSFTNPINVLSFEAEFSENSTNGLAAVYFNGNLLGLIDQDYTTPGLQKYSYPLPEVFYDRPNTLGFRLDGTNTGAASIMVTNLAVSYYGLPEPAALQPSLAEANKLRVEISGISGHPYSFQTSTNLVDWVPVGIVLVTNSPAGSKGTVVYEENVGAENRRFLRTME